MKKARLSTKSLGFIFFVLLLSSSCKFENFHKATLWCRINTRDSFTLYTMRIPGRCRCLYYVGEDADEKIYTYPDSSYLFMADNLPIGTIPHQANKSKFDSTLSSISMQKIIYAKSNPESGDLRGKFVEGVYLGKCKHY